MRRVRPKALWQSFRDLASSYHSATKVQQQVPSVRESVLDTALDIEAPKTTPELTSQKAHAPSPALQRLIETFIEASKSRTAPKKRYGKGNFLQESFDGVPDTTWERSRDWKAATRSTSIEATLNPQLNLHFNNSNQFNEQSNDSSSWTQHKSILVKPDHISLWKTTTSPKYHRVLNFESLNRPFKERLTDTPSTHISLWSVQSNLLFHATKAQERGETLESKTIVDSLWLLLIELIKLHYHRSSIEDERYQSVKSQFLAIWSFVLQDYGVNLPNSISKGQEPDWGNALRFAKTQILDTCNISTRFKIMFPTCSKDDQLATTAAASFAYMIMDPKNFTNHANFICFLGHLLNGSDSTVAQQAKPMFKNVSVSASRRFLRILNEFQRHAEIVVASNEEYPSTGQLIRHFKRKLTHSIKMGVTGNLAETLKDWTMTFRVFYNHWKSQQEIPYLTSLLARILIKAAYKDGNMQDVTDIWSQVIYKGYQPSMEDFTLRIVGAGKLRKLSEVDENWSLLCSKCEPDQWAIGARIVAYIDCDEPEKALDLFTEHSNTWIRAANQKGLTNLAEVNDFPGIPKFHTKTVNTILTTLSQKGHKVLMNKAVHLAQGMGIKLDRMTWNTIVNAADVDGPDAALKMVDEMMKSGIRPGRTTYNILIHSIHRHGEGSKEEEWDKVKKFLDHMKSNNVPVGKDTLATCLKLLLWKHNDLEKALEIFDEATNKGSVDHVMATVLINHLFSNPNEANLATIRSLWSKVFRGKLEADSILWEEMAHGYASINEIHRMNEILGGMHSRRMKFRWSILHICLNAAIRNQKWQDARRVVKIARISNGRKVAESSKDENFQKEFWKLAMSYGLSTVDKWKTVENEMGIKRDYKGSLRPFKRVDLEGLESSNK